MVSGMMGKILDTKHNNMRTETLPKRLKYVKDLYKMKTFTNSDMLDLAKQHHVSLVIPYHLKKTGKLNELGGGKFTLNGSNTYAIASAVCTEERNYLKAKKKKYKKIEKPSPVIVADISVSSFSDQQLIDELKRRGYSGEISKVFRV